MKGCSTSREVWQKLEGIYASSGPARKATLFKSLMLNRMQLGSDIRDHLRQFFDTADKLSEMNVTVDPELISIMLLYSLPSSFENFRSAVESRDTLPTPDILRVKINEESDAKQRNAQGNTSVMFTNKRNTQSLNQRNYEKINNFNSNNFSSFKFKCHRCKKVGHKVKNCPEKMKSSESVKNATVFCAVEASLADSRINSGRWCLDSGASSHFCANEKSFSKITHPRNDKLNLASTASIEIVAEGEITLETRVRDEDKIISLKNVLYVPDLRINLLSV